MQVTKYLKFTFVLSSLENGRHLRTRARPIYCACHCFVSEYLCYVSPSLSLSMVHSIHARTHTHTLTPLNTRMAGTYNPIPNTYAEKIITLNYERIKYWLVIGAQPSVCLCLCLFFLCWGVFCVLIFTLVMFFFCMTNHRAWWIHNSLQVCI